MTGHRPLTKYNLFLFPPKNDPSVMERDELGAFTAALRLEVNRWRIEGGEGTSCRECAFKVIKKSQEIMLANQF